jgi:hypothetical protein
LVLADAQVPTTSKITMVGLGKEAENLTAITFLLSRSDLITLHDPESEELLKPAQLRKSVKGERKILGL